MRKYLNPKYSVIIINWNGVDDTRDCVKSLLNDGCIKEIIVWDNGSQVNEARILDLEFKKNIRIVRSRKNIGFAEANNRAVKISKGEIVILLNNDTIVTRNWLVPIEEIFSKKEDIAAIQPKILNWYNKKLFDYAGACGGFLDKLGYPFTRGRVFLNLESDHGQYDTNIEVDWVSGACFAIRKNDYLGLGGLDKHFFAYMEEIDLCWRLTTSDRKLLCCPKSVIYHKGCRSWKKRLFKKKYLEHRNNLILLFKNVPYRAILPIIGLRYVYECISIFYYFSKREYKNGLAVFLAIGYGTCHGWYYLIKWRGRRSLGRRNFIIVNEFFMFGRQTYASIRNYHKSLP